MVHRPAPVCCRVFCARKTPSCSALGLCTAEDSENLSCTQQLLTKHDHEADLPTTYSSNKCSSSASTLPAALHSFDTAAPAARIVDLALRANRCAVGSRAFTGVNLYFSAYSWSEFAGAWDAALVCGRAGVVWRCFHVEREWEKCDMAMTSLPSR